MLFVTIFIFPAIIEKNPDRGVMFLDAMLLALFFIGIWSAESWRLIAISATLFLIHLILKLIRYADIPNAYAVEEKMVACLNIVVFAYINFRLLFRDDKVNFDRIVGAVNVYLLVALLGAFLFDLLGAFIGQPPLTGNVELSGEGEDYAHYAYFSLVCLTTVGFGDIYPSMQATRMLSVFLSGVGILYPAVVIARLVSSASAEKEQKSNYQDEKKD